MKDIQHNQIKDELFRIASHNYDSETLYQFRELVRSLKQKHIKIVEYGCWECSFYYNLLGLEAEGYTLDYTGYDTFDTFPIQHLLEVDIAKEKTKEDYVAKVDNFITKSKDDIQKYVPKANLIQGDILDIQKFETGDIIYIDIDMYSVLEKVMDNLDLTGVSLVVIDDLYQPSWVGITKYMENFIKKNKQYILIQMPAYLGMALTPRNKYIGILKKRQNMGY